MHIVSKRKADSPPPPHTVALLRSPRDWTRTADCSCINIQHRIPGEWRAVNPLAVTLIFPDHLICLCVRDLQTKASPWIHMAFLLTGIAGASAAEMPPHGLFIIHAGRGRRECRSCLCVWCGCVWRGRREAPYMRRRFYGNVVRSIWGDYLTELWGVM